MNVAKDQLDRIDRQSSDEDRETFRVHGSVLESGEMFEGDTLVLLRQNYTENYKARVIKSDISDIPKILRDRIDNSLESNYEFRIDKSDWENLQSAEYELSSDYPENSQMIEEWWSTSE